MDEEVKNEQVQRLVLNTAFDEKQDRMVKWYVQARNDEEKDKRIQVMVILNKLIDRIKEYSDERIESIHHHLFLEE